MSIDVFEQAMAIARSGTELEYPAELRRAIESVMESDERGEPVVARFGSSISGQ